MLKIKSKRELIVNVELTLTTDHTGKEQDFTVRVSRELLAGMTPLELKTMMRDKYEDLYKDFLNEKVDELVDPLIGVDFSEEDLTPPPEPETPEEP